MRSPKFASSTPTLAAVALALLACEADRVGVDGVTLEIRAPREGTVVVGAVNGRVGPLTPARLTVFEDGPYTVTFADGDERLTVMEAPGPVVDLGALLGAQPVVRGVPEPLLLRAAEVGATDAVAVVDGRLYTPVERGAGWRFELPQGRPIDLVVVWRTRDEVDRVGHRRVSSTAEARGRTLVMIPTATVTRDLAVELPASPRGWVDVELTVAGVRTGIVLGGGVAGAREAVALPRPASWPAGALWVQATARAAGQVTPVATAAVHVPADTRELSLRWQRIDDLSPQPGPPADTRPLDRSGASFSWLEQTARATYLDIELAGLGACGASRWRVVVPASAGAVTLPDPGLDDPLALPLLEGTVTAVHLSGLDYPTILSPGAPAPEQLPARTARVDWRTVAGAWRGGLACAPATQPAPGLYRRASACVPGDAGPLALVDRCGRFVDLDAPEGPVCGVFQGRGLVHPTGGVVGVERSGDGFVLAVPADPRTYRSADLEAIPAESTLRGDWFRVELVEQRFTWVDGALGPAVPDSVANLGGGGPAAGPWLTVSADGGLTLSTRRWGFTGAITRFDGQRGEIRTLGSACDAPDVSLSLTEDGALELTAIRPTDDPNEVVRRRATLYR